MLHYKKLPYLYLRSGTREGCSLSPLLFNIVQDVLATEVRQGKEIKGVKLERRK